MLGHESILKNGGCREALLRPSKALHEKHGHMKYRQGASVHCVPAQASKQFWARENAWTVGFFLQNHEAIADRPEIFDMK